ncbi:MAG: hypothetical protein JWQ38_41 [Flavipsychrobacter sp.]|nr:hypothetical protein [Flavipsychrobacter sp.]
MEIYDPYGNELSSDRPPVYAGFWQRFGASFLDALIILIPLKIINWCFFTGIYSPMLFNLIAGWLYSALLESGPGMATLGKKALGLKVTDLRGGRISFGQATGRHFGKIISSIILLIGYLMMLWDDKKQTLHDKMAGTLVISE